MTEAQAQKIVTMLVTAFPAQLSRQTEQQQLQFADVYRAMLLDLDYLLAQAALEQLFATSRFMPTIAELRDIAMQLAHGALRPGGDAWGSVLAAIRGAGEHKTPGRDFVFKDPLVAKCVTALGWRELCTSDNLTADRARFIELYDKLARQQRAEQVTAGLPALQRYRALEAGKATQATPIGEARAMGQLLPFVAPGAGSE